MIYSDGVYDGSDEKARREIESIVRDRKTIAAKEICNAILEYAVTQDDYLKRTGQADRIDDKTAFIIKHS